MLIRLIRISAIQDIRNEKKKHKDKTEQYMRWNNGPEKEQDPNNKTLT